MRLYKFKAICFNILNCPKEWKMSKKRAVFGNLVLVLFLAVLAGEIGSAADPGHSAGVIGQGNFESGSYNFPFNLTIGGNFSVGLGAVKFYVNNFSGRVGIGTASPLDILEVKGGAVVISENNSEGYSLNVSNVLYVNGSGKIVGIGTAIPTQLLDVRGAVNVSSEIYVQNGSAVSVWLYNATTATATLHNATWSSIFNQSYANLNTTEAIQALLNSTRIYINETYHYLWYNHSLIAVNTLNGTYNPLWYNYTLIPISIFNASYAGLNTTEAIQALINSTGIYSKFNQSYANLNSSSLMASMLNNTFFNGLWNISGENITSYDFGKKVGIGTASPVTTLDVGGNITVNSSIVRSAGAADLVIDGNGRNVVIVI